MVWESPWVTMSPPHDGREVLVVYKTARKAKRIVAKWTTGKFGNEYWQSSTGVALGDDTNIIAWCELPSMPEGL